MRLFTAVFTLAAGLLCMSPAAFATQAVTIIGNNDDAQKCSMAAQIVANNGFASRDDLATCDRALEYGSLKRRDLAGTYVNRGIVATSLSRFNEAYGNYNRAIKIIPDLPEAYIGRGNIHFMAGKLDRAIDDYSRALDLNLSREHVAFLNLGIVYEKLKQYDAAEENYRLALEALPDWTLAQKRLSMVRAKQTVTP
jgi:tetratricopeptide (TPR) repeat protein